MTTFREFRAALCPGNISFIHWCCIMRTYGEIYQIQMQYSTDTHHWGASLKESWKDSLRFCSCSPRLYHGYEATYTRSSLFQCQTLTVRYFLTSEWKCQTGLMWTSSVDTSYSDAGITTVQCSTRLEGRAPELPGCLWKVTRDCCITVAVTGVHTGDLKKHDRGCRVNYSIAVKSRKFNKKCL